MTPRGTVSHSPCAHKPHLYQAAALPGRSGATGPLADKEMQSSCWNRVLEGKGGSRDQNYWQQKTHIRSFEGQAICLRLFTYSKAKRPQRDLQVFFSMLLSRVLTLCNKTGRKPARSLPNKARSSHRHPHSLQLMQKGRRALDHPWESHAPARQAFRKAAVGSTRKHLLCLPWLREQALLDDHCALPAPFLEAAASTAAIKSPRNRQTLAACFIALCLVVQSLAVVRLSNMKTALLLIPHETKNYCAGQTSVFA